MNLWGSSGGGGATHEVELDRCLFTEIDFYGATRVDLGLGFSKHRKRDRGKGSREFV